MTYILNKADRALFYSRNDAKDRRLGELQADGGKQRTASGHVEEYSPIQKGRGEQWGQNQ